MDSAYGATIVETPRGMRLETALQNRIEHFLRIPPANIREMANVTVRPSPAGLARQEFREEERGLCKIRRYNPDMLRPTTIAGYFDASARLAQVMLPCRWLQVLRTSIYL